MHSEERFCRVSALRLGGWGFDSPGRVIPKTVKMGPNTSLLGTQQKGLDWVTGGPGGLVGLIPEPGDLCRMSLPLSCQSTVLSNKGKNTQR